MLKITKFLTLKEYFFVCERPFIITEYTSIINDFKK